MPIACTSPNSIASPSWSIPVSEICEFNWKKKKKKKNNNSKSGYFRFYTFTTIQMDPFDFDSMVTIILLKVQMNAH